MRLSTVEFLHAELLGEAGGDEGGHLRLGRPRIGTRGGGPPADRGAARANQVAIDEFHRWASPLQDAIARVVAENLAAMLGTPHVTVFSQPTAAGARYRVLVDVLRFESAPGEAATLDAVWTVRSKNDGSTRSGRTTVSEPVPDREYATLAAAHSRALGRLSADLAGAIQALERGQ